MKIRISPLYRDFLTSLGVQVVNVPPGEIYTALERGVVDGYGWPIYSIFDLGWNEKTKYRVEPGFYNAETSIVMNLDAWKRLTPAQRAVLDPALAYAEGLNEDYKTINAGEAKKQADAGIQVIRFEGEDGRQFVRRAYYEGWKEIVARAPENGPLLRRYLASNQ
nr:TRAP-type C4-dicarboxylate transport system, periplasmic component [uncultured bacterium]